MNSRVIQSCGLAFVMAGVLGLALFSGCTGGSQEVFDTVADTVEDLTDDKETPAITELRLTPEVPATGESFLLSASTDYDEESIARLEVAFFFPSNASVSTDDVRVEIEEQTVLDLPEEPSLSSCPDGRQLFQFGVWPSDIPDRAKITGLQIRGAKTGENPDATIRASAHFAVPTCEDEFGDFDVQEEINF